MKKNVKLTCFIVLCMFAVLYIVPSASADVAKPDWVSGDKWEYASSEYGITTTTTLEFEAVKTINVNGTDYEVYSMKKEDKISMYGINLTYPGQVYYQRSDLGMVKMDQTMSILGFSTSDVTTYAPPKKDCKFPLSVGQTWTETYTEITYSTMDDEITSYYEETYTDIYTVLSQETVTVEAGTFETYKIQCVDEDGDSIYSWYSPDVKNFVKMSVGTSTSQLTSYEVTAPKTSGNGDPKEVGADGEFDLFAMPYLLFLILIPVIVVVLAAGLVARGRKKKKTQAQVASQPTAAYTVQGAPAAQPQYTQAQAQPRYAQQPAQQTAQPRYAQQPAQQTNQQWYAQQAAAQPGYAQAPQRTAPVSRAAPKQAQAPLRTAPARTQAARPPARAAPPRAQPAQAPQRTAPAQRAAPKRAQTQPARPPAQPKPTPKTQPARAPPPRQAPPPKQQQPPPPPPPNPVYPCPTCKQPLDLIKQYNRWYCRTCKKYP